MIKIEIDIDTLSITHALQRLQTAGANPRPVLQEIGEYLVVSTKERFKSKKAPDGSTWADNSPATQAQKKGRSDPLVGESKSLSRQIHYRTTANTLTVGSPMEYSAVQQFGASQGQFGKTGRGRPIPFGDIPARPFLGLSKDDEDNITDIINEYLEGLIRPS